MFFVRFVVAMFAVFAVSTGIAAPVFEDLGASGQYQELAADTAERQDLAATAAQPVRLNKEILAARPGQRFELGLPAGPALALSFREFRDHGNGYRTWIAEPVDQKAPSTLITIGPEGQLAGHVHANGQMWELQASGRMGEHEALLVDVTLLQPEDGFCEVELAEELADVAVSDTIRDKALDEGPTVAGIVFAIDNGKATRWHGAITATLENTVARANLAFQNAEIDLVLENRGWRWIGFPAQLYQSGDRTMLSLFGTSGVTTEDLIERPYLSGVQDAHALRAETESMFVTFVTEGIEGDWACGRGYVNTREWQFRPSSLVNWIGGVCANNGQVLAHEIGHNLGAHHDYEDRGRSWNGTAVGYSGSNFKTIMSYANKPRQDTFSNPDTDCDGEPCGSDVENVAAAFQETRLIAEHVVVPGFGADVEGEVLLDVDNRYRERMNRWQIRKVDGVPGGWMDVRLKREGEVIFHHPRAPVTQNNLFDIPGSLAPGMQGSDMQVVIENSADIFETVAIDVEAPMIGNPRLMAHRSQEAARLSASSIPLDGFFTIQVSLTGPDDETRILHESRPVGEGSVGVVAVPVGGLECGSAYSTKWRFETDWGESIVRERDFRTRSCGQDDDQFDVSLEVLEVAPRTIEVEAAAPGADWVTVHVESSQGMHEFSEQTDSAMMSLEDLPCNETAKLVASSGFNRDFSLSESVMVDLPPCETPRISLGQEQVTVDMESVYAVVAVEREDAGHLAADMIVRTVADTAKPAEQYLDRMIYFSWAPGETNAREFLVPLHPAGFGEEARSFRVELMAPVSPFAAEIGEVGSTEVRIGAIEMPVAAFEYDCDGLRCAFDGGASRGGEHEIEDWEWDFGDGRRDFWSGAEVTRSYQQPGEYTVSLGVLTEAGLYDEVSRVISVADRSDEDEDEDSDDRDRQTDSGDSSSSSGCTLGSGRPDPLIPLLLLVSLIAWSRRQAANSL
ncbi:M12 family metallo-peptidase [Natronospira sp.]|uniref:M12 family metallo-peptidase n=1 Tax=Natronospira sp. TaxID=2024970 RepID=UPI0038733A3F